MSCSGRVSNNNQNSRSRFKWLTDSNTERLKLFNGKVNGKAAKFIHEEGMLTAWQLLCKMLCQTCFPRWLPVSHQTWSLKTKKQMPSLSIADEPWTTSIWRVYNNEPQALLSLPLPQQELESIFPTLHSGLNIYCTHLSLSPEFVYRCLVSSDFFSS